MTTKPLLHTQPVTATGLLPSRELVEIIQRLKDAIGSGGSLADGNYGGVTVSGGGTVISLNSEPIDDRVAALLVAGSNITLTYNDAANTLTIASTGGGSSINGGTATLNFGAAPGGTTATVAVTGQAGILSGSRIKAWVRGSTADHNAYEHSTVLSDIAVGIGDVVAGTGFTIYGTTDLRLTGQVQAAWEWV